nr:RNA-directed DNA polymerase, eukaryota [Tanacetum cinerariifolium]
VPDIEAMDNISKKKSDEDVSDDQDNITDGQKDLHAEEGEIQEALVTQIEMGKVLGYDIEGSTNDLKKLIEGIGDKHGLS